MKLKLLFFAVISLAFSDLVIGQSIFTNPITGTNPNTANPYTTGQTVNANITASGIGRGSGITGTGANDRYTATGWNSGALDVTDYFEFILTPNANYAINFVSFVYTSQASGTGPTAFAVRSSADGFAANTGSPTVTGATINLSAAAYQNITAAITFRVYGWGAIAAGGTFSINDFTFNGTVALTAPTINTGALTAFGNVCVGNNPVNNYTVSGAYLTNDIVINAPTGFEIKTAASPTYGSTVTLTPSSGTVASTTINVRFSPAAPGAVSGNITHTSTGATTRNVAVSGTGVALQTPTVNIAANPTGAICAGKPVTFTATPGTIGGGTATYQWKLNGTNIATGTTYTATLNNGDSVTCVLTVTGGCVTTPTANSAAIVMTVDPAPAAPSAPTLATVNPQCGPTTLNTMAFPAGQELFWQGTSSATESTALPTTATYPISGNGTYYVKARSIATGCWSTATSVVVTYGTTPAITVHPVSITRTIPATASFSVTSNGTSWQWEISTDFGGSWNAITGANAATYNAGATTEAMNGYRYRCVITTNCGSLTSNVAILTTANGAPNNALTLSTCIGTTSVDLSWTAATGSPTGYIVFALPGATAPAMTAATAGNANSYVSNANYAAANSYTTLGKAVYKGTGVTATITGLAATTAYTFKVVAYTGETATGWAAGINANGSWNATYTTGVPNGTLTSASVAANSSVVNWTNPLPTACYEMMLVANQGPVSFVPTGNGTAYTANTVYSGANQVVFKGTGNVVTVTGLTEGQQYCYRLFTRKLGTTEWSTGVSICQTTGLTYCPSIGNTLYATGIRRVVFNTIDNATAASTNAYSDFTAITTSVDIGGMYNLAVNANTAGNYTVYTKVWIDWNRNGTFDTPSEEYDLGTTEDQVDGATSESPLNIEVPSNAVPGNVRMRVATKYNLASTPCETGFDGEVEDYTLNVIRPAGAEINIKGAGISISNGFDTPYALNNTLFGSFNIGTPSAPKTYTVENVGLSALSLSGTPIINIVGANPGDFTVVAQPAASVASLGSVTFNIIFTPSGDGQRNAIVLIANNDLTDGENPYTFAVRGTGVCATTVTSTMWPASGPVNTEVTFTSPSNLTGATAKINGVLMPIVTSTATSLVVTVPATATTGTINLILATGCSSATLFTVINNQITGCQTGSSATPPGNLFISEVTDATKGSSSFIEVFNGTNATINLSGYSLRIYNNGNTTSPSGTVTLTGSLAPGGTHLVSIGTTTCAVSGFSHPVNQVASTLGGINFNNDSGDMIGLYAGSTLVDAFGVFGSETWSNGLGYGTNGIDFKRKNTAPILPNPTFSLADWDVVDWTTCADSDYSGLGVYDFSLGIPPSVLQQPAFAATCTAATAEITTLGQEGVPNGATLLYQWYELVPGATNWTLFGTPTATPPITVNTANVGYQYYAQIRESSSTCYTATNAVKIEPAQIVTWNDGWLPNPPTANSTVVIKTLYDTYIDGDFEACSMTIEDGGSVLIKDGDFVTVHYNLTVDAGGTLDVANQGSLVMTEDSGIVTNNGTMQVHKTTTPYNKFDYTYWSSPVATTITNAFVTNASPLPWRIDYAFIFNTANFSDLTGPNGTGPADGFDDNQNDWTAVPGATSMTAGVGYAIMGPTGGSFPATNTVSFTGKVNNGLVTVPIVLSGNNADALDDFNLVGNPYPSAISADKFITDNTNFAGTLYFWTHRTGISVSNPGPDANNFIGVDYAMYTYMGGTGTAPSGTGSPTPTGNVASGQGFFIETITPGSVHFDNSMRKNTYDNNNFYRSANVDAVPVAGELEKDRIWLNLQNADGFFSQQLIGYTDRATLGFDRGYDGIVNKAPNAVSFYSFIEGNEYRIQGRPSFSTADVIPLGYSTTINGSFTISIDNVEGVLKDAQTNVYLEDRLLNITHNLKQSAYVFHTEIGTHDSRFVLRYVQSTLGNADFETAANAVIVASSNAEIHVKSSHEALSSVIVYDITGRLVFQKQHIDSNELLISNAVLNRQALVLKIVLANGQVVNRKIIF